MKRLPDLRPDLADVPLLARACVKQELPGGLASNSWLVEDGGKAMVLRIDTPLARALKLDRAAELGVLETVAAAGIGPDVIWADPAAGVLVTRYIHGSVWTGEDMHDPAHLRSLAGTLRRLHGLITAGPEFDPAGAALTYATAIATESAADLADKAAALARQLLTPGGRHVLCHNDLVHMNIIGSQPVRLIDWEYAAVGDPLFDLAVVVRHHQLPAPAAKEFLHRYRGTLDAATEERFRAFCQLYDLLSDLWYLAVGKHSKLTPG